MCNYSLSELYDDTLDIHMTQKPGTLVKYIQQMDKQEIIEVSVVEQIGSFSFIVSTFHYDLVQSPI